MEKYFSSVIVIRDRILEQRWIKGDIGDRKQILIRCNYPDNYNGMNMCDQSGSEYLWEKRALNRSILAWWKHSSPIERVTLLFRVMACVYAREVTKLTYLLLKPNEPNPNLVSRNDIPFLFRSFVCKFLLPTVNNNKIGLVRSFIRALFVYRI